MRIQEIDYEGQPPIDSFGAGGFRINDTFHAGHLILTPTVQTEWAVDPAALTVEAFAPLLSNTAEVDVLLVGMGQEIAPLPAAIRTALEAEGMGVETMSTNSACRTYNVLLAEDRRVAVALIAV